MANDPDAIIAAVSAFIDTEVAQIASLTAQLAAAVGTDTASPDVQAALTALQNKITAIQATSSTANPPSPPYPPSPAAPSTPPASS